VNPDLSDTHAHERAADQIPWYVNGTLEPSEASRLAAHLDECAPCRRDYEGQVRLFEAVQADGTLVFAAETSFQKLMARIGDAADAKSLLGSPAPVTAVSGVPTRRRARGGVTRWLAAAAVLEALFLGYGAWVWHARDTVPAPYVTLTSPEPSYRDSPRVRIVFRSGLSVQGLGVLLHGAGAHIVDGPTAANVYTLGFTGAGVTPLIVEQRAAALRANADVLFAEPQGTPQGSEGGATR
jgi:Putative zinc-finger